MRREKEKRKVERQFSGFERMLCCGEMPFTMPWIGGIHTQISRVELRLDSSEWMSRGWIGINEFIGNKMILSTNTVKEVRRHSRFGSKLWNIERMTSIRRQTPLIYGWNRNDETCTVTRGRKKMKMIHPVLEVHVVFGQTSSISTGAPRRRINFIGKNINKRRMTANSLDKERQESDTHV